MHPNHYRVTYTQKALWVRRMSRRIVGGGEGDVSEGGIQEGAEQETPGNMEKMVRKLLG